MADFEDKQRASITTTAAGNQAESNGHSSQAQDDDGDLSYEDRAAFAGVDPDEDDELVTTDELLQEPSSAKSRGAENSPVPRTLIVLGGVGVFALVVWLFSALFTGGGQQQVADTDEALPEETTDSFDDDDRLRAELALVEQGRDEPRSQIAETPEPPQEAEPSEETVEIEPTPEPPRRVVSSSSPPPPPAPAPVTAMPEPEPEIDPLDQWSRLSQLGATGQQVALVSQEIQDSQAQSDTASTISPAETNSRRSPQSAQPSSRFTSATIGDDPISRPEEPGASALMGTTPRSSRSSQFSQVQFVNSNQRVAQRQPRSSNRSPGTQGILQQRRVPLQQQQQQEPHIRQVRIGSSTEAEVTVPMIYAGGDGPSNGRSAVTLTRPLMDINGEVALPEGTILITELSSISPSNIVGLDVIAIVYEDRNGNVQQEEIESGVLEIRGEDNDALVAESETPGSDSFGDDLLVGLLGAAGRVGEYLISGNTSISTSSSSSGDFTSTSTSTTTNRDNNNVAAAALAGFFEPVAQRVSERSQSDNNDRQPYLEIEEGEDVSVYVRGRLEVAI